MSTLTERAVLSSRDWSTSASRMMTNAARSWFVVAALGQLIFAYYIAVLYGVSALRGDWAAWNSVMPRGLNTGDTVGNIAITVHLLFALILLAPVYAARAEGTYLPAQRVGASRVTA